MSLTINHLVVHALQKTEQDLVLKPRDALLDSTPVTETFVEDTHHGYNAKSGKTYGAFIDSSRFAAEAQSWMADQTDFLQFSQASLSLLGAEIEKYDFAESGYLIMADYEYVGVRYLLISLFSLQSHFKVDQSLGLSSDQHLDISKVQLAARIDITTWQREPENNRYISFIKGRAGRKVADFFLDFLGCEEGVAAKQQTEQMVTAVEAFLSTEQMNQDEKQEARKSLVDYCKQQKTLGEEVSMQSVAEVVGEHADHDFQSFYQENGYELESSFPAEVSVANKLTKFSGYGGGIAVNFERKHLGQSIIYDPVADTLTIRQVPPNLRDQLQRFAKGE